MHEDLEKVNTTELLFKIDFLSNIWSFSNNKDSEVWKSDVFLNCVVEALYRCYMQCFNSPWG